MGLLSEAIGDVGLGLEIGSELERMLENDITPATRLGVYDSMLASDRQRRQERRKDGKKKGTRLTFEAGVARADGAGVSVRARGGSTVDAGPFEWALDMARCLKLGDVTVRLPADGLIDPVEGAG